MSRRMHIDDRITQVNNDIMVKRRPRILLLLFFLVETTSCLLGTVQLLARSTCLEMPNKSMRNATQ